VGIFVLNAIESANFIVIEIKEDIDWATRGGKNASGKKFADWLRKTWPDEPGRE